MPCWSAEPGRSRGSNSFDAVVDLASSQAGEGSGAVDLGELIDARAREAYRSRILDLRSEVEEAERFADTGRAARLRGELDALQPFPPRDRDAVQPRARGAAVNATPRDLAPNDDFIASEVPPARRSG
jgi:hypothetical protein